MIDYYLLMKPGIILGNLVTVSAGFLLASKGTVDFPLFFATLIGLSFIIASACIFNNYIDRFVDRKMERTKARGFARELVSPQKGLILGTLLGLMGALIFLFYTPFVTLLIALAGFFIYVSLYSFYKVHTIYATAIGSLAGATPPVIGYVSASGHFDGGAFILLMMMVLWQMPHFYAIALFHLEDYAKANLPLLPLKKGILRTKVHMVFYILGFTLVAMMLSFFGYTGSIFQGAALFFGAAWLILSLKGLFAQDTKLFGKKMFRFSLILIVSLSIIMPMDAQELSPKTNPLLQYSD